MAPAHVPRTGRPCRTKLRSGPSSPMSWMSFTSVVLSPPSGTFAEPFSVSMTTSSAGAEIRYTTDGQTPTTLSPLYDGTPVPVSATTRFLANAFVSGESVSVPTAAFYVHRSGDVTSDLPLIVIDDYAAPGAGDPLERLSAREREVLQLVAEGRTGAEIATRLSLSQKTVETYRARLVEKLGIRDVAGLVKFAIQRGLVSLD